MKKLTASVLAVVLSSSVAMISAQTKPSDTAKTTEIGEVIITGAMGITKKADAITSAQQVVSSEMLTQASNPNIVQALSGKVAGLTINLNNSSVNSSSSIQLRGIRTISGNNDALVVIDNVVSTATILQGLPPDIIESINVIKGAQGAALYGSDGGNGVIIVTTKRGAKNKISVVYNGSIDFETVAFLPKRQTKYGQGWDKARDQYENGAWGPVFDGSMTAYGLPLYDYNGDGFISLDGIGWGDDASTTSGDNPAAIIKPYSARTNELKNFFKTGTTFSNGITINAGSEGKYAMLSLNNSQREFIVEGDNSSVTSVLFKGGAKVDKLTFDGSINYSRVNFTQTTTMFDETSNDSLYWTLLQSSVDIPITSYRDYPESAYAWNIYYQNPYWRMKHVRQDYKRDNFNITGSVGYEINKNINIKYTANLQKRISSSTSHRDAFSKANYNEAASPYVKAITSALFIDKRENTGYYGDLMSNFNYDLTDDLNFKFNLGYNYQEHKYEIMQNGGSALAVPGVYNMSNVTLPLSFGSASLTNGHYRKNSHAVFANLDLAYKNYLFLNATARNEWSSILPKNNNSYFYPSVGLSFVPTKAWQFGSDVLTYMKVSGNWTRVGGTGPIDWYSINRTAELVAGFPMNNVNSYRNGMVQVDPNIRPEFTTTTEANIDLGFFKDRIRVNGSIYKQDTKDLITDQTSSSAAGINVKRINIAKMTSKGAEINLGLTPIKTSDFKWDINAGYSYNESIVDDIMDGVDEIALVSGSTWGIYAQKGSVFPMLKVSKMQRDDQGRIIINAANGNPLLSSTLENAGSTVPKSVYTFSTNLSYKGFKLGAVADYRYGAKFIADVKSGLAFNGSLFDSGEVDREKGGFIMPNSVISDGNGGYTPNTTIKTGGNNYSSVITWFSGNFANYGENLLADGTAFKIREVSLSYTLPKDMMKAYGMEEVTFGVYARNPFQKFADNNLNYADPETSFYSGQGRGVASRTQYPSTKVYGFSLNLKF
ncbi:SusC/RagA family TonB-linked outer membrane protein [Chryseobacterium sp. POL2]|uniref:SusC/RagA family TonB-linked outer membrane protein n=1 Tax=Chryseobacterium sp. POL2 TaxID=2713414 RepID=UPI0013E1A428|nr:SusC/RagA family TonB-linked outer membrane protein [Chryseobacterium sp. POL2]QIG89420.1 SusC/RagA family TonB-linked outer membrane protein [Chryseobacterium sp. POL2]